MIKKLYSILIAAVLLMGLTAYSVKPENPGCNSPLRYDPCICHPC